MSGLLFVLALHAAALSWLWRQQLVSPIDETTAVFVSFIEPAQTQVVKASKPVAAPQLPPHPTEPERPRLLSVGIPEPSSAEFVVPVVPAQSGVMPAPPTPPASAKTNVNLTPHPSAGALALTTELSVICPQRVAPVYPALSRRLGETGTVLLRVELNESGEVTGAQVQGSSGYARLDDAALHAVRSWRCTPASRNGLAVRATALQPFHFVLQGN